MFLNLFLKVIMKLSYIPSVLINLYEMKWILNIIQKNVVSLCFCVSSSMFFMGSVKPKNLPLSGLPLSYPEQLVGIR